mmetsp:Transcript_1791/g.5697  ORF Transcript_1791/g.5697 Transcript_1791/m.5697 type:complete len:248 (+) Transcript_1791:447-1190(+)
MSATRATIGSQSGLPVHPRALAWQAHRRQHLGLGSSSCVVQLAVTVGRMEPSMWLILTMAASLHGRRVLLLAAPSSLRITREGPCALRCHAPSEQGRRGCCTWRTFQLSWCTSTGCSSNLKVVQRFMPRAWSSQTGPPACGHHVRFTLFAHAVFALPGREMSPTSEKLFTWPTVYGMRSSASKMGKCKSVHGQPLQARWLESTQPFLWLESAAALHLQTLLLKGLHQPLLAEHVSSSGSCAHLLVHG